MPTRAQPAETQAPRATGEPLQLVPDVMHRPEDVQRDAEQQRRDLALDAATVNTYPEFIGNKAVVSIDTPLRVRTIDAHGSEVVGLLNRGDSFEIAEVRTFCQESGVSPNHLWARIDGTQNWVAIRRLDNAAFNVTITAADVTGATAAERNTATFSDENCDLPVPANDNLPAANDNSPATPELTAADLNRQQLEDLDAQLQQPELVEPPENVCEEGKIRIHVLNVNLPALRDLVRRGIPLTREHFLAADRPLRGEGVTARVVNPDAGWLARQIGADKQVAAGFEQRISRDPDNLGGYHTEAGAGVTPEAVLDLDQAVYLNIPGVTVLDGAGGAAEDREIVRAFKEFFGADGGTDMHNYYQQAGNERQPVILGPGMACDQYVLVVSRSRDSSGDSSSTPTGAPTSAPTGSDGPCCNVSGNAGAAAGSSGGI